MPQSNDTYKTRTTIKPPKKLKLYGPPAPPNLIAPNVNSSGPFALPTTTLNKPALNAPKFWETEKFKALAAKVLRATNNTPYLPGGLTPAQSEMIARNNVRSDRINKDSRIPKTLSEAEFIAKYEQQKPNILNAQPINAGVFPAQPNSRINPAFNTAHGPNVPLTEKMYPTPESSGRDTGPATITNLQGEPVPFTSQTAVRAQRMALVNEAIMMGWSEQRTNNALAVYDATNGLQKFSPFNSGTYAVEEIADEASPAPFPALGNMAANAMMWLIEGMNKNFELQTPVRVSTTTGKWVLQSPVVIDNVTELRSEREVLAEQLLLGKETVGQYWNEYTIPLTPERRAELQDRMNYLDGRITKAVSDGKRLDDAYATLQYSQFLSTKANANWYSQMSDVAKRMMETSEGVGLPIAIGSVIGEGLKRTWVMEYYDTPEKKAAAKAMEMNLKTSGEALYQEMMRLKDNPQIVVTPAKPATIADAERQMDKNQVYNERLAQDLKKIVGEAPRLTPENLARYIDEINSDPDLRAPSDLTSLEERIIRKFMKEREAYFGRAVTGMDLQFKPTTYVGVFQELNVPAEYRPATEEDFKDLQNKMVWAKMQEQDLRYKQEVHNPMNSATWVREPWREEIFRRNLAILEVQLGRPVTLLEIRQMKQEYNNMATEFAFEMAFDILNIVEPIAIADDIVPGFKLSREVFAKSIKSGFLDTIRPVPYLGWIFRETIATQATKRADLMNNVLNGMRVAYPGNMEAFTDDLVKTGNLLFETVGKTDVEARAIFKKAQDANEIKGLTNISYDKFKQLRDLADASSGGIDPASWKEKYLLALSDAEEGLTIDAKKIALREAKQNDEDALRRNLVGYVPATEPEINARAGEILKDLLNNPIHTGIAQNRFVEEFKKTFERPYRLYVDKNGRSSRMMTDTLYGQIAQKLRMLGGQLSDMPHVEQLENVAKNNALKVNGDMFWSEIFEGVKSGRISFGEAFDMNIINIGKRRNIDTQSLATKMATVMEWGAELSSIAYGFWAMSVLSLNPRWVIQNLIDSSGRSFIYGGNPLQDVRMLHNGMHRKLIAEMGGELPIELIQMARSGIDFADSVPGRLLYSDFNPGMGPLSFYKAERERLARQITENVANTGGQVPSVMAATENMSPLAKTLRRMKDGFGSALLAAPAAISDYNTAIEFTVRLRMFHKEYFAILDKVEPMFKNLGREGLSQPVNRLISQLWDEAGENPAKLRAMVDDIVSDLSIAPVKVKTRNGVEIMEMTTEQIANQRTRAWSMLFNEDIEDALHALNTAEKVNFLSDVSDNFHELRKSKAAMGQDITDEDIDKFIDTYRENMRMQVQTQMDLQKKNMTGHMSPTGLAPTAAKFPNLKDIFTNVRDDFKNTFSPFVLSASQTPGQMAVKQLDALSKGTDNTKFIKAYTETMSPMGEVIEVAEGASRVYSKDGKIVIQLGSDVKGKTPREIVPILRELTIRSMGMNEVSYLRSSGYTVEQFTEAMKFFIGDTRGPIELLERDPKAFRMIANQFDLNPHLRKALEQLQGNRPILYNTEAILDKRFANNEVVMQIGDPVWKEMLKSDAAKNTVAPTAALVAGDIKAEATASLYKLLESMTDLGQRQELQFFIDKYNYFNGQLAQFHFHSGPAQFNARNPLRAKAWKLYWAQRTKTLQDDAKFITELVAMFKGDTTEALDSFLMNAAGQPYKVNPESGLEVVRSYEENFAEAFLNSHGFSNIDTDNFGHITNFSMAIPNKDFPAGKSFHFYRGQGGTTHTVRILEGFFFSDLVRQQTLGIREIAKDGLLKPGRSAMEQIKDALVYVFASESKHLTQEQGAHAARVIDAHIKEMVRIGGGAITYEDVMRRFGFARVKGPMTYADNLALSAGAAKDRVMIYGFANQHAFKGLVSQMSTMFYRDMVWLSNKLGPGEAFDNLRAIEKLIFRISGERVFSGNLTKKQSEVLSELFIKYVMTGTDNETRGMKTAFENFRKYINRSFKDATQVTALVDDINPEMFQMIDHLFLGTKLDAPKANQKIIELLAKRNGLKLNPDELLAMMNNHAALNGFGRPAVEKIVKEFENAGFMKEDAEQFTELMWVISKSKNPDKPEDWLNSWQILSADGDVSIVNLFRATRGSELLYGGLDRTYMNFMVKEAFAMQKSAGESALGRLSIDIANANTITERMIYLSTIAGYSEEGADIAETIFNDLRKANLIPDNIMYQRMAPPVDSPNFKAWFENSVVRDAEGKPMVMYHGSSTADIDAFDKGRISKGNLYGPGFYFTDTPHVASSYAPTGHAGISRLNLGLKEATEKFAFLQRPPEIFNPIESKIAAIAEDIMTKGKWESAVDKFFVSATEQEKDDYLSHLLYIQLQSYGPEELARKYEAVLGGHEPSFPSWEKARKILEDEKLLSYTNPGVMPVYMSIQNPFDINRMYRWNEIEGWISSKYDPKQTAFIMDAIERESVMTNYISGEDLWNIFQESPTMNLDEAGTNKFLQELGFDGITHIGGRKVGGLGEHRVYIAFEPTQVKSVSNNGGWSKTDPRMLYQQAPDKFIGKVFRGVSEKGPADPGDMGVGRYFTDYESYAKQYGTVQASELTLVSPLRINAEEAQAYVEKYGTLALQQGNENSRRMTEDLIKEGYDGLIVEGWETPPGYHTFVEFPDEMLRAHLAETKGLTNNTDIENFMSAVMFQRELDEQGADNFVRAIFQFAEKEGNLEKELLYNVRNAVSDQEQIRILSAIHNRDSEMATKIYTELYNKGGLLFQEDEATNAPMFYLKSKVLIQSRFKGKMRAEDARRFLLNNGISEDEMFWSGLDAALTPRVLPSPESYKSGGIGEFPGADGKNIKLELFSSDSDSPFFYFDGKQFYNPWVPEKKFNSLREAVKDSTNAMVDKDYLLDAIESTKFGTENVYQKSQPINFIRPFEKFELGDLDREVAGPYSHLDELPGDEDKMVASYYLTWNNKRYGEDRTEVIYSYQKPDGSIKYVGLSNNTQASRPEFDSLQSAFANIQSYRVQDYLTPYENLSPDDFTFTWDEGISESAFEKKVSDLVTAQDESGKGLTDYYENDNSDKRLFYSYKSTNGSEVFISEDGNQFKTAQAVWDYTKLNKEKMFLSIDYAGTPIADAPTPKIKINGQGQFVISSPYEERVSNSFEEAVIAFRDATIRQDSNIRWQNMNLLGGSNYRNTVVTIPNVSGKYGYTSNHFSDIENYLYHIRSEDVDDVRVLLELQSDRIAGLSKHKLGDITAEFVSGDDKTQTFRFFEDGELIETNTYATHPVRGVYNEKSAAEMYSSQKAMAGAVPPTPLVDKYQEHGLKNLVHQAIEDGKNSIAIVSNKEQIARIERWMKHGDKDKFDNMIMRLEMMAEDASTPEQAKGIRNTIKSMNSITKFYLEDLPKKLRKYANQYGATIEMKIIGGEEMLVMTFSEKMKKSVLEIGEPMWQKRGNARGAFWTSKDQAGNVRRWTALVKEKAKVDTFIHEVMGHGTLDDIMTSNDWRTRSVEKWSGLQQGEFAQLAESNKLYDELKTELLHPKTSQSRQKEVRMLLDEHRERALKYVSIHEKFADGAIVYIKTGFSPTEEMRKVFEYVKKALTEIWQHLKGSYPDLDEDMIKVYDSLFKVDHSKVRMPKRFTSLGDVPLDYAENVLKLTKAQRLSEELNTAFMSFRNRIDVGMFPNSALSSYEAFRQYLTNKIATSEGSIEDAYRNIMVQLENFVDGISKFHMGDELESFLNPVIPDAQMGESARTLIAHSVDNLRVLEGMEEALDEMRAYWKAMRANNGTMIPNMTQSEREDLARWSKEAARNKANMLSIVINGGEARDDAGKVIARSEGALPKTNKVLLDYNTRTNFDAVMKNFFPFWMFPSRSLPFWASAMVEHPAVPAMYFRIKRASESARYQAGAVDSQGRPMSSLDGYIPIPGTDHWFNPLAPFSFRYLLDITKSMDNLKYRQPETEETLTGVAYIVKEFMTAGPIIGFNMSPWTGYFFKSAFQIPDDVLPQWSIAPQFNLIPKWAVRPYLESNWGVFNGIRNMASYWMFPEPSWQDALIEKRILENYNAKYGDLTSMTPEALAAQKAANTAITEKGTNPLWLSTYKEMTQDDATRNLAAFFSGVYTKTFTDASADLIAIKLDSRAMRQAMNNQFVATEIGMPLGDEDRWEYYLNTYRYAETPEAWTSRMYTDIGWVKNTDGKVVTDQAERNKLLALQVKMTENSRLYYFDRKRLTTKLHEDLAKLPIGTSGEASSLIYDAYYAELARLVKHYELPEYMYYVNSNKPISIVEKELRNQWWYQIRSTMPTYDVEKDWKTYEKSVQDWQLGLDKQAQILAKSYYGFYMEMYGKYSEDQLKLANKNFLPDLIKETTQKGYQQYRLENDTIVDAANEVWRINYWDKYWDAVEGLSGDRRRLAELEFIQQNPAPDEAKIYNWINKVYGEGRFSYGEVKTLMGATPEDETKIYFDPESKTFKTKNVISVQQRLDSGKTKEELAVNNIYNIIGWAGPTTGRAILEQAYISAGGQKDDFNTWFATGGTGFNSNPSKLLDMEKRLKKAAAALGLEAPTGASLQQRIKAADLKAKFEEMVALDDELGPHFLDYPDPANNIPQGTYSEYSNTSFDQRKLWKKQNPEKWKQIQTYQNMQKQFARENPLYAAYYVEYKKFEDTGIPAIMEDEATPAASSPTSGSPSFFQPTKVPENMEQDNPELRPDTTAGGTLVTARNVPKLAVIPWPKGFAKTVGQDVVSEISNLYRNGKWLSQPAKDFLYDLAKRHREWRGFIYSTLQR